MHKLLDAPASKILPFDINDPELSLNIPLWYPYSDMDGNPIYCYNKNRHQGVVTNTTYGVEGRTFAGVDKIVFSNHSDFDISGGVITIIAWVNNAMDADYPIISRDGAVERGYYFRTRNGGTIQFYANDGAGKSHETAAMVSPNIATMIGVTSNGTNYKFYHNGRLFETSGAIALGNVSPNNPLEIGHDPRTDDYYSGLIGHVLVLSRELTARDHANIYNFTKWRY